MSLSDVQNTQKQRTHHHHHDDKQRKVEFFSFYSAVLNMLTQIEVHKRRVTKKLKLHPSRAWVNAWEKFSNFTSATSKNKSHEKYASWMFVIYLLYSAGRKKLSEKIWKVFPIAERSSSSMSICCWLCTSLIHSFFSRPPEPEARCIVVISEHFFSWLMIICHTHNTNSTSEWKAQKIWKVELRKFQAIHCLSPSTPRRQKKRKTENDDDE